MKVCASRGAAIPDAARFCPTCAAPVEPFTLRALGFARNDEGLIAQAIQRFEAMGLDWHAAETRKLLSPV